MNNDVYRCVGCFEKQGNRLLKEIPLKGIELARLQEIFGVPADDPMYDVWDIDSRRAEQLEPYLPEKLDLEQYDCSLHCYQAEVE